MPHLCPVDWSVVHVDESRREHLIAQFCIEDLAGRIAKEALAVTFSKERGTHEAKGAWRAVFVIEVPEELFDLFFNNPCGYRGHFLASPELGELANTHLLSAVTPRLMAALPASMSCDSNIHGSLGSPAAKIWIDEDHHDPSTPELNVQVLVSTWISAATEIHTRLKAADATLTQKEIDRIYGVRAPIGTRLKVFGAWIDPTGIRPVVPSKQRRSFEIHAFGVS